MTRTRAAHRRNVSEHRTASVVASAAMSSDAFDGMPAVPIAIPERAAAPDGPHTAAGSPRKRRTAAAAPAAHAARKSVAHSPQVSSSFPTGFWMPQDASLDLAPAAEPAAGDQTVPRARQWMNTDGFLASSPQAPSRTRDVFATATTPGSPVSQLRRAFQDARLAAHASLLPEPSSPTRARRASAANAAANEPRTLDMAVDAGAFPPANEPSRTPTLRVKACEESPEAFRAPENRPRTRLQARLGAAALPEDHHAVESDHLGQGSIFSPVFAVLQGGARQFTQLVKSLSPLSVRVVDRPDLSPSQSSPHSARAALAACAATPTGSLRLLDSATPSPRSSSPPNSAASVRILGDTFHDVRPMLEDHDVAGQPAGSRTPTPRLVRVVGGPARSSTAGPDTVYYYARAAEDASGPAVVVAATRDDAAADDEYDETCVLENLVLADRSLESSQSLCDQSYASSVASSGSARSDEFVATAVRREYRYELHTMELADAFSWIASLPPHKSVAPVDRPLALPPRDPSVPPGTMSLVLDLDETLVHCTTTGTLEMRHLYDIDFPVTFNGRSHLVMGRLRPGVREFLKNCSRHFEVIVFTASLQIYAEKVLDILDPERRWIKHRLFRDSCLQVESNYVKDLTVLGRDLARTVIIDNSIQAFGYHLDNGIPISSWYQEEDDCELAEIYSFLVRHVRDAPDVTRPIVERFQIASRLQDFVQQHASECF